MSPTTVLISPPSGTDHLTVLGHTCQRLMVTFTMRDGAPSAADVEGTNFDRIVWEEAITDGPTLAELVTATERLTGHTLANLLDLQGL